MEALVSQVKHEGQAVLFDRLMPRERSNLQAQQKRLYECGIISIIKARTILVADEETHHAWARRLRDFHIPHSGEIDRYYFRSLYFREPNQVLFELATDGPGFAVDESLSDLGKSLALPPFLEGRRAEIEANLEEL